MRGYLLLPHLAPVLVVELATAAFAVIAWGGLPPAHLLGPLLLAMLGGQLAIGATNELVDLPFDTVGKPWKPLPSGDVSIRGAQVMVVIGLIMMVAFGWRFGILALGLLAAGTGLGIAYDLWFKRTVWSWLPYLLALPLLPIWVFASLGKPEPKLLLLYPLGALATVGVHFAQALPDVAIDRAAGLPTATSRLGQRAHLRRRLADDALGAGVGLARRLAARRRAAVFRHRASRRADALVAGRQCHPGRGQPAHRDRRLFPAGGSCDVGVRPGLDAGRVEVGNSFSGKPFG